MKFLFNLWINLILLEAINQECFILINKNINIHQHITSLKFKLTTVAVFPIQIYHYYHGYVSNFHHHQLIILNENKEVVFIKCLTGIKDYLRENKNCIQHKKGEEVKVYLIDSAIRLSHQEIKGNIQLEPNINLNSNQNEIIHYEHGTKMASVIVGKTLGLAIKAMIHSYNVIEEDDLFYEMIKTAFNDACSKASSFKTIINLSLGYDIEDKGKPPYLDKCTNAIVVYAAGNESVNAQELLFIPEAIVVGSVYNNGQKTKFSNYGTIVDIYTYGDSICVANHEDDHSTCYESGTSISTAYISGFLAVIQSQSYFKLTTYQAKQILIYFSEEQEQSYDSDDYEHEEDFVPYLRVFPNRNKLNEIRLFGKF